MIIVCDTHQLRKLVSTNSIAVRQLGAPCAKKLKRRIDELSDCANLEAMSAYPGNCHELKGDYAGHLAVNLHGGFRLVFRPEHDPIPRKPDGGLDRCRVTEIRVVAIEDYHGHAN